MSSWNKNYTSGDVVLLSYYPHKEDKSQGEPRWVICLEDLHDSIIAVPLTKNTSHQIHNPGSLIITKDCEEGKKMKLLYDSLILPNRALRIYKPKGRKYGSCSDELIDKLLELVEIS